MIVWFELISPLPLGPARLTAPLMPVPGWVQFDKSRPSHETWIVTADRLSGGALRVTTKSGRSDAAEKS